MIGDHIHKYRPGKQETEMENGHAHTISSADVTAITLGHWHKMPEILDPRLPNEYDTGRPHAVGDQRV